MSSPSPAPSVPPVPVLWHSFGLFRCKHASFGGSASSLLHPTAPPIIAAQRGNRRRIFIATPYPRTPHRQDRRRPANLSQLSPPRTPKRDHSGYATDQFAAIKRAWRSRRSRPAGACAARNPATPARPCARIPPHDAARSSAPIHERSHSRSPAAAARSCASEIDPPNRAARPPAKAELSHVHARRRDADPGLVGLDERVLLGQLGVDP
jgi:hypothetical protein